MPELDLSLSELDRERFFDLLDGVGTAARHGPDRLTDGELALVLPFPPLIVLLTEFAGSRAGAPSLPLLLGRALCGMERAGRMAVAVAELDPPSIGAAMRTRGVFAQPPALEGPDRRLGLAFLDHR